MKNVKSLVSAALLACCSLFAVQSNAALITQSVSVQGQEFLSYTMELDDSLINSGAGLIYAYYEPEYSDYSDPGFELVDLNVVLAEGYDLFLDYFVVGIDVDNIFAGIEFFELDAADSAYWAHSFAYDAYDTAFNFLEVWDFTPGLDEEYVGGYYGDDITVVNTIQVQASEPSVLALFALGFGGLVMRRRMK